MFRETAIFSVFALLVGIYLAKNNLLSRDEDVKVTLEHETMFTPLSLSDYDGKTSPQLYLSIMGEVFDVSSGDKHYGPGGSYNFFIGKDATRNFVDGNFDCKKKCDDATGLTAQELRALDNWVKFYKKSYSHIGKLIGKYYDEEGDLTPYGREIHNLIRKALEDETEEDKLKMRYPGCNMEWDLDRGTHFWCSDQSGGIKRNWIGVPRKLFAPGSKKHRCACIREDDLNTNNIKEYENCDPISTECYQK